MEGPGHDASAELPDGRALEYWEGGDPEGLGVLLHDGTPVTRVFGRLGHEAALEHGVRLVSINRPGYGGSELPTGPPSLRRTGRDTADLARRLGMNEYAVLGASGGAPFAVAAAVADPEGVTGLGIMAGVGPWRELNEPSQDADDIEERRLLGLLDAGDVAGAWAGYRAYIARAFGGLAGLDDDARLEAFFAPMGGPPQDPYRRSLWAANLAEVVQRLDGFALDNLAWGGGWDVDPGDVVAPTTLWYGDADGMCPPKYGEWYAERIAGAELVILPGEGHGEVCFDHWSQTLATVLARWRP